VAVRGGFAATGLRATDATPMSWNPRAHGYLLLLLALTGQIVLGITDAPYPYVREGVVTAVMVFVLVKVFDRPAYRIFSLVTGLFVLGSLWVMRVAPNLEARRLEILMHLGMAIFFALAVSMVLRHLFERACGQDRRHPRHTVRIPAGRDGVRKPVLRDLADRAGSFLPAGGGPSRLLALLCA
jgi:hypothetical protein